MFCYMKFVQHTETNNIQTKIKLLGLQVKWLSITVNHAIMMFHWYIRVKHELIYTQMLSDNVDLHSEILKLFLLYQ